MEVQISGEGSYCNCTTELLVRVPPVSGACKVAPLEMHTLQQSEVCLGYTYLAHSVWLNGLIYPASHL